MSTLVVFSHPNHELAIFGLLQRRRPRLLYLTDGGGPNRVTETQRGLESIGLADRATFLDYPEQRFYDALVEADTGFFKAVAGRVRDGVRDQPPDQVLCDAVEFYNPVHDMSLPIVRAALDGSGTLPVFEVPLIYQTAASDEAYEVQRWPDSRRADQLEIRLSRRELAVKTTARDTIYTSLVAQLGPVVAALPPTHLALEVLAPARSRLPEPGVDGALRYERRARLLATRGEITIEITYRDHYLPVASSLVSTG